MAKLNVLVKTSCQSWLYLSIKEVVQHRVTVYQDEQQDIESEKGMIYVGSKACVGWTGHRGSPLLLEQRWTNQHIRIIYSG